jgi:SEC-C motif-containing protein
MLSLTNQRMPMLLHPLCPCGSAAHYTDCCKPYLTGKAAAPTAEALMRSRFVQEGGQWFYVDGDILPPLKLT